MARKWNSLEPKTLRIAVLYRIGSCNVRNRISDSHPGTPHSKSELTKTQKIDFTTYDQTQNTRISPPMLLTVSNNMNGVLSSLVIASVITVTLASSEFSPYGDLCPYGYFRGLDGGCYERNCENFYMYAPVEWTGRNKKMKEHDWMIWNVTKWMKFLIQ